MKKTSKKFLSLVLAILTAGIFVVPSLSTLAAPAVSANWTTAGNHPFNFNWSPQTVIGAANVQNLVPQWIFPLPASPPPFSGTGSEGVVMTPMIVQGVTYFVTNWNRVYALNAKTGATIWSKDLPILNITSKNYACPNGKIGCGVPTGGHWHNGFIQYTDQFSGQPLVWFSTPDYEIFAYNALTGDLFLKFQWFNPDTPVAGSHGIWDPLSSNQIVIDQKRGILITGTELVDCACEARGFIVGFDLKSNPPKQLWQTFVLPPQDGSDPNWSLNSVNAMDHAWIFNGVNQVDLKSLSSSVLSTMLVGDWGNFGYNGSRSYGGLGVNWGGPWALDSATGTVYPSTAEPAPWGWDPNTHGPLLWGSSILSMDVTTGRIKWAFQTTPHDLWDYDCSWGAVLANVTINGSPTQELMKGCKNGYLYGVDAATGKMNWAFNAPSTRWTKSAFGGLHGWWDPRNQTSMNMPCIQRITNKSAVCNATYVTYNCPTSGCIESDFAYDPQRNIAIVSVYNDVITWKVTATGPGAPYVGNVGTDFATFAFIPNTANTTVWAVDASTGQPKWHYFLGNYGYRGGVTTSNGVVFVSTPEGALKYIDATTGNLIGSTFIGAPSIIQPSIGTDSDLNMKVILPAAGISTAFGGFGVGGSVATPGFIVALGLPPQAPGVTTTATAVLTSTATAVSTSTAVSTTTVVQTPTTAGIDPSTFYAVTGVAVIFVITTGLLVVRRRKPAAP